MSNPQQVAEAFQKTVAPIAGLGNVQGKGSQVSFGVTGTAAGATTKDQATFFNKDTDTAIDSTYALATVTNLSSSIFSIAETGEFRAHNPAQVANVNVVNASDNDVIASMNLQIARYTPSGAEASEQVSALAYLTNQDFQRDGVQFPLKEMLDGYTFVRLLSDSQVAAATYKAIFSMGPIVDRRAMVPTVGAKVVVPS